MIKETTKTRPPSGKGVILEDGGVASAHGFMAAGVHAGFRKKQGRLDFALVAAEDPCAAAGVFTQNTFCAAPVQVSKENLGGQSFGYAQAVIVNSGNANAATGAPGIAVARASAAKTAEVVGCAPGEVLIASTGVIGPQLTMAPFEEGIPRAFELLSREGGFDAATAIMTTDTRPKQFALSYESASNGYAGALFTIGGMAKGSGMIMPNMATMIAVITTDAPLSPEASYKALYAASQISFNKVTVDSDTSTNDTAFLMASAKAPGLVSGTPMIEEGTPAYHEFTTELIQVCSNLARQIAADGEGATKLITVTVRGAESEADADAAARAVANSPLVKTAVFGHDANWGRIAMALGKSGARFRQEAVSIDIMGLSVCRAGLPVDFDEEEALRRFEAPEIVLEADLGAGKANATIWTCDFSHDYITINGDYRT